MTERPVLPSDQIAPAALERLANFQADTLQRVRDAVTRHPVVVVGMAQNTHVGRVRRALQDAGIAFEYIEIGSYLSGWRARLAIKLWSGWPTFPQVFVQGQLIGGEDLTKAAVADSTLQARLRADAAETA